MRSILLGLVCAAAFSFLLIGETHASGEIPFEFRDGLIWVKVETAARSFNFVLDSGAGASVIDPRVATALGIKLGRQLPVLGVDSRAAARYAEGFVGRMGDVSLNRSVLAIDMTNVSRSCCQRIDGLIGADWFRGRVVQIDFRTKRLRVADQGNEPPNGVALPIKARNDAFCVPIAVNGSKPSWVRLDTGCNTPLQFVVDRRTASTWLQTSIGLARTTGRVASEEVQLGQKRLAGVKIGLHEQEIFPGESGLLGTGILSKFTVTIDLKANRLFLADN